MILRIILYFVFSILSLPAVAIETSNQCDPCLDKFPDDCQLQVRYRELRKAFRERNLNIDFISLYRVSRLIDSRIIDFSEIEGKESYDNIISKPWEIYSPAPKSWILWECGNYFREVLNFALDYREAEQKSGWGLSIHDLEKLHKVYVDPQVQFENGGGKLGNFFSSWFGLAISPIHEAPGIMRQPFCDKELLHCDSGSITLQNEEISAINSFEQRTLDGKPYIQWCKAGSNKGRIQYLNAEYVISEMTRLIAEINTRVQQYLSKDPSITESPLQFVARIQRSYVAIHPFRQGNGRMSRYLQDLILAKLDMPLIPGGYLQNDLSVSLKEYQSSTLLAVKNILSRLESCLDPKNKTLECQSLYGNKNVDSVLEKIHTNIRGIIGSLFSEDQEYVNEFKKGARGLPHKFYDSLLVSYDWGNLDRNYYPYYEYNRKLNYKHHRILYKVHMRPFEELANHFFPMIIK